MDERRRLQLACDLVLLREPCEQTAKALVEGRNRPCQSIGVEQRRGEDVGLDGLGRSGLDLDPHRAAMLSDLLRSLPHMRGRPQLRRRRADTGLMAAPALRRLVSSRAYSARQLDLEAPTQLPPTPPAQPPQPPPPG